MSVTYDRVATVKRVVKYRQMAPAVQISSAVAVAASDGCWRCAVRWPVLCLLVFLAASPAMLLWQRPALAEDGLPAAIRAEIERVMDSGTLAESDAPIAAAPLIAEVYARRKFAAAWTDPERTAELLAVAQATYDHGLDPIDYHLERIHETHKSRDSGLSAEAGASRELMLTDSLIRIAFHLRFGKVNANSLENRVDFIAPLGTDDAAETVAALLDSRNLDIDVPALAPSSERYAGLMAQLRHYRSLEAAGGWPLVPDGPTIEPDATDRRLAALATRLAITGDLDATYEPGELYDTDLQEAVRRFQVRHGLEPDALVGPKTLRALNIPVGHRVDQIRLALERNRWLQDVGDEYLRVNVASFMAEIVRGGNTVWTTRAIIGTVDDKTPIFRSAIRHVVFNPTWTVPRSIATEELLPRIQGDPTYLERGGYYMFDSSGATVDPAEIDWGSMTAQTFSYTLVQRPGPRNELGKVKFIFANEFSICMHDTPSRSLFDRSARAFSHGCIRIEKPIELAEIILASDGWDEQQVRARIDSGVTSTAYLSAPMPLVLVYWTADVGEQGNITFFNDFYDRDAALLRVLDQPLDVEIAGMRPGRSH